MGTLTYTYPDIQENTVAQADVVETNFEDVQNVVNGGLDDDNLEDNGITASSKVKDGTVDANCMAADSIREAALDHANANLGVQVVRCGPNYPGSGTNGRRIAWVSKSITPTATATTDDFTFTFASDCVDGNPGFAAAPNLGAPSWYYSGAYVDGDLITNFYWSAKSATQCTLHVVYASAQANPAVAITCEFPVYGTV